MYIKNSHARTPAHKRTRPKTVYIIYLPNFTWSFIGSHRKYSQMNVCACVRAPYLLTLARTPTHILTHTAFVHESKQKTETLVHKHIDGSWNWSSTTLVYILNLQSAHRSFFQKDRGGSERDRVRAREST